MKFLNAEGQLVEGTSLTEEQVSLRAKICAFVHEEVCGGTYHSQYDRKNYGLKCEQVANYFITHFTLTPLTDTNLEVDTAELERKNQPEPAEIPVVPVPMTEDSGPF